MLQDTIILMRHGRTPENEREILIGHTDAKLNANGRDDVRKGAEEIYQECIFPLIFSNPQAKQIKVVLAAPDLVRNLETSDIVRAVLEKKGRGIVSCVQLQPDPRLRERHFGTFERHPSQELKDAWTTAFKDAVARGGAATWNIPRASSVETDGRLLARFVPGILAAYEQASTLITANEVGCLVVCGNGSTLRTLSTNIYGTDPGAIANGSHIQLTLAQVQAIATKLTSFTLV